MASQLSSHLHQILFNIPPPPFELDNPSRVSQRSLMLNRQSCVLHLITTIIYFVISATRCICNLQSPLKIVWSKFSVVAKCHLELACPGLAAAVLWSPALSLVIIQDVQRLPSRSPLMSCHISVIELHIFNFFITHRLMFSRILPVCPNLHLPAVQSPPSPLHLHFNLQNLCKTWDACNISHPAPTAPHVCRLRVHGAARVGSRGLMNIFILLSARKCWRMTAGRGAAALAKHSTTNFAALLHNNVHMLTRDEEIRMGAW